MVLNLIIVVVLVLLAGTYAGLTLALFSLRLIALETKVRTGDRNAEKVYEIRKKGNLLLCTLLLGNVASYTAMTVFLGSITTGVVAGTIATALIFIFAEILPQAAFPRYALLIGGKLYWFVWVTLVIFYPICAPIAWILDKILGKEAPVLWSKQELGELVSFHKDVGDGIIDKDEERIILGALGFSDIKAADIMIPKEAVFYLEPTVVIDQTLIEQIKDKGYSRIPVYNSRTHHIEGIVYTRHLLGILPGQKITEFCDATHLIIIPGSMKLDELLNLLIQRKLQMAVVVNESDHFAGIATLEDIMEEILKTEIEERKA